MNLGEINDILRYIANKTQGGNLPPARFQDIMNMASRMLLNDYLPSRYKENPKLAYEETQKISDDIYPFKRIPIDLPIDDNGRALYPADYVMCSSMRKVTTYKNSATPHESIRKQVPVNILDDNAIAGVLTSRIVQPALNRPYATMYSDYIQFWPYNLQTVRFTYIRMPVKIIYGIIMTNNRPVYDPTTSTETDWPEICQNALILKALSLMGINLREDQLQKNVAELAAGGVSV